MDYVSNVTVDGENNLITVAIPTHWIFYRTMQGGTEREVGYGNHFTTVANKNTSHYIYPFGATINSNGAVNGGRLLDISNLPIGSRVDMVFDISFSGNDFTVDDHGYWDFDFWYYQYQADGSLQSVFADGSGTSGTLSSSPLSYTWYYTPHDEQDHFDALGWAIQLNTLGGSDGAADYELSVSYSASITMTLSAAYYEYLQGQENSAILNEIEQQLEEQNMTLQQILDELWGGDGADDLIDNSGSMGDVGADLDDGVGQIQDFENQYFGQLEDSLDDITAAGDLSFLSAPLSFVQHYLDLIVDGIPPGYLAIFTLPILFGIFLYIVGHPIKAPRPDTSGDQVTRETFTTTTVLSGRHAGDTSSTRTVTTTQEIGRVHK